MGMRLWSNVLRWYSRFWDGRELVEDDERGGHPKSIQTEVNITAVADFVKNDHRITSRMIAESLNILKTVVLWILKEDLGNRKLCARFVLHSLTPEQREDRVTSCQDIFAMADADNFFEQNYYGRWDLVFCLWPQNEVTEFWTGWWDIPSAEEPKFQRSCVKTTLIIFFWFSKRSAKRIHTRGKNSKCTIL